MEDYRLEQTGQEVQRILNGAAMDANLQAEVERATDAEGTLQENIDAEAQARQDADGLLQQEIDDEAQRAKDAEEANAGEIEGIKALIPSTATSANKLADTNYVNSSIQTATAEYRGNYNVVTDLHLAIDATHAQIETLLPTVIAEADKNDYCYVMIPTSAQTPTEIAKIERYKMTSEGWKFEYDVNNSTFTAEEWAAIKSGITSGLVAKLNALPTNADLLLLLAGKQDVLTFDSVPVPESNNPVKSGGVYSAIDDEKTARLNSDTAIHAELDGLQAKVPATASSDNKLVDQNQMNSSISTATATYRGDWNVVSDLHLAVDATRAQIAALLPTVISTADNNDYCYVEIPTSAETPTQIERVERYKFNGTAWAYEYTLNNSGFTADQWAAINSMITSGLVAKLSALPTNADLLAMFATKQDNLTFDPTPTENSTNPVTSGGVFAADKALSDAIEAILLLIPSAATSLNKLVDTALMNSSISTATATFRGTYNLVRDLSLGIDATEQQIAAALALAISTADNNDYAFVQIPTSAETPTQIARTDRYKFNGTAWAFEYTLNTSGFTAAQWAAINSTITSALVAKLNALPTAAELQEALGTLTSGITAINQKIPSTASQSNKLVDNASMESYIAQVINILDASFNVTSTDGHITLHITQVDGVITSVQVQSSDIASAADLALKASQADLTALASRVSTAESNITSLTSRIGTAETNIANLQQLYNNLQQSKPVPVTALPSTGLQQGVIYRLAGTTSYSDYMWNGSSWVLMATYNNALDDVPTAGSSNLTKSGGITKWINDIGIMPDIEIHYNNVVINNTILRTNGGTANVAYYHTTGYIDVNENTVFTAFGLWLGGGQGDYAGFCVYDASKTFLAYGGSPSASNLWLMEVNIRELYPTAAYIRFSLTNADSGKGYVHIYNNGLISELYKLTPPDIYKYNELTPNNILLKPDGTTEQQNGYYTSGYIKIDDDTTLEAFGLFIFSQHYAGYCVYDESKTFIAAGGSPSASDLYIAKFNIKDLYPTAGYIRFSLTNIDSGKGWVEIGNSSIVGQMYDDVKKIKDEMSKPYTETIITVKAGGTIGTDCDFTDIKSAMDSITDNTEEKRYVVFVKNGTYDVTGINYLGFKNYVTVRGESQDGVIVRNSTQTSDQNVVCFDPAKYGNSIIDFASVENMTMRIYGGKCNVHIDGSSIKSGGKILIKDVHFINENPDNNVGRGGVNCGLNGGQTVEIENCFGNVLAYAHTRINPSVAAEPNYLIVKNCHLNFIGFYDLNDKIVGGGHNRLIADSCICDYIGIGVGYQASVKTYNSIIYDISNSCKFNWVYIYGQGSIVGYDSWFTRYPICSSIHRVAENHTGMTISKGTFVSVVNSQYNCVPSPQNAQPAYRYNIIPYDGNELFGVLMEDIADGESGIIQVEGKILIADNGYQAGDYITLDSNGQPEIGTKTNAIGIVTDANQQYLGTIVLLKKRDYDYIL